MHVTNRVHVVGWHLGKRDAGADIVDKKRNRAGGSVAYSANRAAGSNIFVVVEKIGFIGIQAAVAERQCVPYEVIFYIHLKFSRLNESK